MREAQLSHPEEGVFSLRLREVTETEGSCVAVEACPEGQKKEVILVDNRLYLYADGFELAFQLSQCSVDVIDGMRPGADYLA